jgi:hypothetical protein
MVFVHVLNIKDVPKTDLNIFIDSCQKENCKYLLHENALVITSTDDIEKTVNTCFNNTVPVHVYKIEVL